MQLDEYRSSLDEWLDDNAGDLAREFDGHGTLDEEMTQLSKVLRLTFDAGFGRWGWPESVGGLGGSSLLRGYLAEAVVSRGLVEPGIYSMTEVLVPTMMDFASPDLAAEMVPRKLRGDETWCQGFSEPGTGSNLASLSCRATLADDTWIVNGQKVWTSLAQWAQRCVLLTRTGTQESAHKGITAMFVDMDTPGITIRPIETMHERPEFCEVFFDDVAVPVARQLGEVGQGWAVAMDLLPYERSTALWVRVAFAERRLQDFLDASRPGDVAAADVGLVYQQLLTLRARSRATQHRMASGETLGPETSIDKILLGGTEQAVFDLILDGLGGEVLLGDDHDQQRWRSDILYSRAATIYGGSSEIQRNIVARRLLDLGSDR